jgi:hypothetical protein
MYPISHIALYLLHIVSYQVERFPFHDDPDAATQVDAST